MNADAKKKVHEAAVTIQNKLRETGTLLEDRMISLTEQGNPLSEVFANIEELCEFIKGKTNE